MKIGTIILEDEPAILREMEWLVKQDDELEVLATATTATDAVALIKQHKPGLLLMDIQLKEGNAFDVLNAIKNEGLEQPRVIFITAYNHFAIKAIKYGAADYLMKPIDEEEFRASIEKIKASPADQIQQQMKLVTDHIAGKNLNLDSQICIPSVEFMQFIKLGDVICCSSDGSYTSFILANGNKVVATKTLKYYEELLPEQFFMRTHQSHIVNKTFIDKFLKSGLLIMKNGLEVPVATRRKEYILQQLIQ